MKIETKGLLSLLGVVVGAGIAAVGIKKLNEVNEELEEVNKVNEDETNEEFKLSLGDITVNSDDGFKITFGRIDEEVIEELEEDINSWEVPEEIISECIISGEEIILDENQDINNTVEESIINSIINDNKALIEEIKSQEITSLNDITDKEKCMLESYFSMTIDQNTELTENMKEVIKFIRLESVFNS